MVTSARRIAIAGLLVMAALPAARAAAGSVPECAPGGAPVAFTGHVTRSDTSADAPRYLLNAFEVVEGTTRVEVTYDWSDDAPSLPATR